MDDFWKTTALILISVVLCSVVAKHEKDIAILITMTACCIAIMMAVSYLKPVLLFLQELESLGQIQDEFLGILIKSAGIALTSEIVGMICSDTGNGSMGKALYILASSGILYLSLPVFRALLTIVQEILGQI